MKKLKVKFNEFYEFLSYLKISNIENFKIENNDIAVFEILNQEELESFSKELSEIVLNLFIDNYFENKKENIEVKNECRDKFLSMTFYYETILKLNIITYFMNNDLLNIKTYLLFNLPDELFKKIDSLYKKTINENQKKSNFDFFISYELLKRGYSKESFSELYIDIVDSDIVFKGKNTKLFKYKNFNFDFGFKMKTLEELADTEFEKYILINISLIKLFSPKVIYIKNDKLKNELEKLYGDDLKIE